MTLAPQQFKMCSTLQLLADGVLLGQLFCSDAWWAGGVVGPGPAAMMMVPGPGGDAHGARRPDPI